LLHICLSPSSSCQSSGTIIVIAGSEGQACIDEISTDLGQGGGVLDEAVPVKPAYRAQFDDCNWSAEE
jgi:hypothetical protein